MPRLYCLRHGHYPSLELTRHGRRLHSLKPPQLGFDSRSQQRPAPSDAVVPSIAWLLSPAVVRRSSAAKAGATFLADVDCHARDTSEPLTRCAPESSAEAAAAVVAAARCDVQPELLLHAAGWGTVRVYCRHKGETDHARRSRDESLLWDLVAGVGGGVRWEGRWPSSS